MNQLCSHIRIVDVSVLYYASQAYTLTKAKNTVTNKVSVNCNCGIVATQLPSIMLVYRNFTVIDIVVNKSYLNSTLVGQRA